MKSDEKKLVAESKIRDFLKVFIDGSPLGAKHMNENEWNMAEQAFKREFKKNEQNQYSVELNELLPFVNSIIHKVVRAMLMEGADRGDIDLEWSEERGDMIVKGVK